MDDNEELQEIELSEEELLSELDEVIEENIAIKIIKESYNE